MKDPKQTRNCKTKNNLVKVLLICAFLLTLTFSAYATDDIMSASQGCLRTIKQNPGNEPVFLDLPLKHTSVNAFVSGFIARVDVVQTFTNDQNDTIEAVYVFPLPDNSAVDAMSMLIGKRKIIAVIKKRQEAEQIYQQARQNGQTAALLTQERPNIFTQSVANILSGDLIEIKISYVQDLRYDHGEYEFNFPMVVGPRFNPSSVHDAARISPPVLRPNQRSGHDIDITLSIDAGVPIENLYSPSHRIARDQDYDRTVTLTLDSSDSIPNKDFIVRYDVTGKQPAIGLQTHNGDNGGFFSLMIQPQDEFSVEEITPKEMVFVVDCSGSMSGAPMAQAKALMRKAIKEMNPGDSFQIIRFSSSASKFSPVPLLNTRSNVQQALQYINSMSGGGGTMMIEGIKAALNYPLDPERMRMVLFLTDGYIGNETEIFGEINKRIGNTRLFSLGVGSSVNHYLLDRMADVGRGFVQYVRPDEDSQPAVELFYNRIRNPLITNISIDWDGLNVKDVYPALIQDLFSEQPVILHGRFSKPGRGTIKVSGIVSGRPWEQEIDVNFPAEEPANDVLSTLWARTRIENLMNRMNRGYRQDIEKDITDLALKFNLMSQYTAFVAVSEEIRRGPDGKMRTVQVPVELPEFVEYEAVCDSLDEISFQTRSSCVKKDKSAGFAGNTVNFLSQGSIPHAKPVIADCEKKEENKELSRGKATFSVRMISGKISDEKIKAELERIRREIEDLFYENMVHCKMAIRLTIKFNGKKRTVEILENDSNNVAFEKSLSQLLEKQMTRLSDGEVVFTVNY